MSNLARTIKDLVIANRILANLGIVDAFGDISVRASGRRSAASCLRAR